MLLQMMVFPFVLIVFGGLGSLIHIATTRVDPDSKGILLFSFAVFYIGVGSIITSFSLYFIFGMVLKSDASWGIGFLTGYLAGGLIGGLIGHRIALKRILRLRNRLFKV